MMPLEHCVARVRLVLGRVDELAERRRHNPSALGSSASRPWLDRDIACWDESGNERSSLSRNHDYMMALKPPSHPFLFDASARLRLRRRGRLQGRVRQEGHGPPTRAWAAVTSHLSAALELTTIEQHCLDHRRNDGVGHYTLFREGESGSRPPSPCATDIWSCRLTVSGCVLPICTTARSRRRPIC